MDNIKEIQSYIEGKYRLFLPIIVLMSLFLQILYLFPDNLIFFSINQILIDGVVVSIVATILIFIFSFVHFLGFYLFKGKYLHKIYNFISLLVIIYYILPHTNNDYQYTGIIASVIGGFMSYTAPDFGRFFRIILWYTFLLTPLLIYVHGSFSLINQVKINGNNYKINYFNTDYFFLEDGSIFDKNGNKYSITP